MYWFLLLFPARSLFLSLPHHHESLCARNIHRFCCQRRRLFAIEHDPEIASGRGGLEGTADDTVAASLFEDVVDR
jgi:hypothetical protein